MPLMLVLGLASGYLYYRSRSIVAPITLHMAYNGTVLLTVLASKSLAAAR